MRKELVWGLLGLSVLAVTGLALPEPRGQPVLAPRERNGKFLSLFNLVVFNNDQCTAASSSSSGQLLGTCYSGTECNDKGGVADGSCASGFGVCCVITKSGCTHTVSENCTYVQNSQYPAYMTSTSSSCVTTFSRPSKDVTGKLCMIRLDFETVQLEVGTNGACSGGGDSLTVAAPFSTNSAAFPPTVCGTLSGQHMYFPTGSNGDPTMTIATGTNGGDRKWNIKVSWIECNNPNKPSSGCTQYFTGLTGSVKSYNFDGQQALASMEYTNCVRQQQGYCSIQWTESSVSSPDPFQLGNDNTAKVACNMASVTVPGVGAGCGSTFNLSPLEGQTVSAAAVSTVTPFNLQFEVSDGTSSTGFHLEYRQLPC